MLSTPTDSVWVAIEGTELPGAALADWVKCAGAGATLIFEGVVRDYSADHVDVRAITYESYHEAAMAQLAAVAQLVRGEVPSVIRLGIWHRVGTVPVGESSLIVGVAAPHRREAFVACELAVDRVKASVPIWKFEHVGQGGGWVTTGQPIVALEQEWSK